MKWHWMPQWNISYNFSTQYFWFIFLLKSIMTGSIVSYQASSWYWRLNGPFRYQDFFLKRIRLFHWTMFVLHTLSPTYQSQAPLGFNIGSPWPAACYCCSTFLTHIVSISKVNYIIGVLFNVFLWKKNTSFKMYSYQFKKIWEFLMA